MTLAVEEDNAKLAVPDVDAEENMDDKLVEGGPCRRHLRMDFSGILCFTTIADSRWVMWDSK